MPGVRVGHYTDLDHATGCTVVLTEGSAVGGMDVRGAAPGSRETEILQPLTSSLCRLAVRADTRRLAAILALTVVWYFGWSLLNESFMGPVQPESVVFFCVLGMAVGRCNP